MKLVSALCIFAIAVANIEMVITVTLDVDPTAVVR